MLNVEGKVVYSELREIVDTRHTALLVVDMQRCYCAPGGICGQRHDLSGVSEIIPRLRRLLGVARKMHVRIAYLKTALPATEAEGMLSPAYARSLLIAGLRDVMAADGTWEAGIVDELAPAEGESVLIRARFGGFVQSSLDLFLRSNGVESVVITGVFTHSAIDATARDSALRGYYPVVVTDCVASYRRDLHEAALRILATRVDLVASDELARLWGRGDVTDTRSTEK